MQKTDLKFSQLIDLMREAVANAGRLAKGDTLTDLVILTKEYEECRECGILKKDIFTHYYWGVRENGTGLTSSQNVIDKWIHDFRNQAIAVYEISFKDGFYTFSLKVSFDEADLVFGQSNYKK